MNPEFVNYVCSSNAHRKSRENIANAALRKPENLAELIGLAQNPAARGHHQSWWALEIVAEADLSLIEPFHETLIDSMTGLSHHGAIRSASKICMILCQGCTSKIATIEIDAHYQDRMRDIALDWLTSNQKVAAKAYSARALFALGAKMPGLLRELADLLSLGYGSHSAAYKAVAKELTQKINRQKA